MEAEDRKLLIDIHGAVSAIKPVLESNASALKSLDDRQRRSEIVGAEHSVKIERLESDVDGLGRKVRAQSDRVRSSGDEGKVLSFFKMLINLPEYWHILFSVGALLTAAFAILRHVAVKVP